MIALPLILALVAAPPQDTAADVGRVTFIAGFCSAFGWEVDAAEGDRMGAAVAAANPDRTMDDLVAEATAAGGALEDSLRAEVEAVADRAGFLAWADRTEARCDAVSASHPALLRRSQATDAAWSEFKAEVARNYP